MSARLLDEGFRSCLPLRVRYDDGGCTPLALQRWQGRARGADDSLLALADAPTLDIGCGPGRLAAAIVGSGVPALGIDISPVAVWLTRRAGAPAALASVFGDVPGSGSWPVAVLADGNIGIGGDPVRLLSRVRAVLAPRGRLLVELESPSTGLVLQRVRLEDHAGRAGSWFPWAQVGVDALTPLAREAGLAVAQSWSAPDVGEHDGGQELRWFAELRAA